jgi:nitrogen fixation/metabolism regulation signal transduction histidine kinase
MHNLIKNAQEAMDGHPGGEIRVETALIAEAEGPVVEICVEDDGPGIEPDLLGRLFDPYVTTKAKGTGLGLAIVKKIIEEHGGIIRADNRNRGACITARLPVWQGEPGNPGPPHETSAQTAPKLNGLPARPPVQAGPD